METQFIIYGKMGSMKKMKPVSGSRFVTNLIHAEVYRITNDEEMQKLIKELSFLKTQGEFELRKA
jgi:hypothetical protein